MSIISDDYDWNAAAIARLTAERDEARAEVERLRAFGEKVNAIRDSIVGAQALNWSEHAYPLVAALDEAGFVGKGYEIARANLGTLIEQIKKAEAEVERLRDTVRKREQEHLEACAEADEHRAENEKLRAQLRDVAERQRERDAQSVYRSPRSEWARDAVCRTPLVTEGES